MTEWQDSAPETRRLGTRFICRVSGAPADGIDTMRAERTLALVAQLHDADAAVATERETVSEALFAAIGAAADRPARNRLLALKRSLYNGRAAAPEALEAACAGLPAEAAGRVRAFSAALEARARLEDELRAAHAAESAGLRQGFRALLDDADFRKGLLISSRSLHGSLARYAAAGGAPGGRDEKTERGLLRYYTRMAMKATPFATFCAIVPGRFLPAEGEREGPPVRLHGDPRAKRSLVRINKTLYGMLMDHLRARPTVRRALTVEPNPTLRPEGARLVFLTALGGREVFQRVPGNEVLQLIAGVFRKRTAPTLGDLIGALSRDPEIEATEEEAEAYLDRLLEIGFLRFHTGIREQDADWDLPLRALLDRIDDDHARQCSALLAGLRERMEAYALADPARRAALIEEMLAAITAAQESMGIEGRLRRDMPFYEDATAEAEAEVALSPATARAVDTLSRWVQLTARLAWPRPEQATMRHFFDTFYTGGQAVPLLQFYEEIYREHFKAHVEKEHRLRAGAGREELAGYDVGNPFALEFIRSLNTARNRLGEAVAARWREAPDAEEVSLSLAEVEEALREVEPQAVPCRSVDAFATLAPPTEPGGDPRLVLQGGSYTAGYGKYFSRFLYLLPDEVTEEVRRGNAALTGERLAEICGDSQFNANLHPPLLRWEISYPTGEGGVAADQLRSSELLVEPDPRDPHALRLRHAPTGQQVIPVDLGFLNPRMRPPLYQLLSRFTVPVTFAPTIPESPVRRPEPPVPAAQVEGDAQPAAGPAPESEAPVAPDAGVPDAVAPEAVVADAVVVDAAGPDATPDAVAPDAATPDAAAGEGQAEAPTAPAPRVGHRPRITVEGRLVLARRRWLVPGVLFPQRGADESAADFFLRAQRWRAEHGIPEVSYVRISPLPDPEARRPGEAAAVPDAQEAAMGEEAPAAVEAEAEEEGAAEAAAPEGQPAADGAPPPAQRPRTQGSRDLFKPQFIDFGNPLLVGLLGKMAANLKHFQASFEERLPDRDGLPAAEGGHYVTELVVQLDFPDDAASADAAPAREEHVAAV